MPLIYENPPADGALRQGEILKGVWIHRVLLPASEPAQDAVSEISSERVPIALVIHADCDLYQDQQYRVTRTAQEPYKEEDPKVIPETLLCHTFTSDELRGRFKSDLWRRVTQNQDERYHHFGPSTISNDANRQVPDLYLDFKRTFAVYTQALYDGIVQGGIERFAVVPPIYLHDLMHRFFGFHSRVGLPDL